MTTPTSPVTRELPDVIYIGSAKYILKSKASEFLDTSQYEQLYRSMNNYIDSCLDDMKEQIEKNNDDGLPIHRAICEGYASALMDLKVEMKQLEKCYED